MEEATFYGMIFKLIAGVMGVALMLVSYLAKEMINEVKCGLREVVKLRLSVARIEQKVFGNGQKPEERVNQD
ncbi:hypothetical protein FUAX_55230 (plasmid) [Fulvitalea axinellae]|uniref:Uncharacterized protein n=1 Tax=Fulvitalea axinellae TaxID=1182444 RepID=A0AAU9DIY5_9BACT|nr:hypothetical protein FUAX_55230 [Fulvitalea axinellae]